ncbi:MAG: hypothetical protein CSA62_05245 [Planctomycetota bacterium]|nr:MAG: hypothetical protein CSA62_05245 [Planctomycetota bacterium]
MQSMAEMDLALGTAEEAAGKGDLALMQSELAKVEALLQEPRVVNLVDEAVYETMRLQVLQMLRDLIKAESVEAARPKFDGVYQACDVCHSIYATRRYDG